jgi:DNA-nicking Smr family endonuclease
MTRRRRRSLTEDDLAVWRAVARTATPLDPGRPTGRPPDLPETAEPPRAGHPDRERGAAKPVPEFRVGEASPKRGSPHDLAPALESRIANMPVRMDKKTFGKLKRGKLKPERKLDLHGMTLAQAHPALIRFILRAHADGLRLVVVVTGKGRTGEDEGGPIPTPRGVLRHQLPGWLHAPELRHAVLQVTDAHLRHGGGGAYYVYLRRGPGERAPRG